MSSTDGCRSSIFRRGVGAALTLAPGGPIKGLYVGYPSQAHKEDMAA
jgi:hypothetical protein